MVVIPITVTPGCCSQEYAGVGVIKKVIIKPKDPMLTVILQLDIQYPLDKKQRQEIPLKAVNYSSKLAFRLKFNS